MNMKRLLIVCAVLILSGCAISPQSLTVAPTLSFERLQGVTTPVELIIKDKRNNEKLLGYRNAKKQGEISFTDSVAKSLGEKIQAGLVYQGVNMATGEESATRLEVQVYKLSYFTPDESWVSTIEMNAEILVAVDRGGASVKKRFKSNRKQDVVTAPNKEFNEKFMNTLLSELLNKALNDKEIVNFLK
mgnify:CR=1 FL=1